MLYVNIHVAFFKHFQIYSGLVVSISMVLIVLCIGSLDAAWLLKQPIDGADGPPTCYLESDARTVNDGYDDIRAHLRVNSDTIAIMTEAPLDMEFADIGLRIDQHPLIKMDDVMGRKHAQFKTPYEELVTAFKKGRQVRAQLRFWPTWPATGTHSVVFSLRGFSKAYAMMQKCKP